MFVCICPSTVAGSTYFIKQMSHNDVIMICTFGFVISFVPAEFRFSVLYFIISTEEESNSSTPLSFDFGSH